MFNHHISHLESTAIVLHNSIRLLQLALKNDVVAEKWENATPDQRSSSRRAVVWRLQNPNAQPNEQHDQWMRDRIANGWVYGEVKDTERKTHPCLVPYDELPEGERLKDELVGVIVDNAYKKVQRREDIYNTATAELLNYNEDMTPKVWNRLGSHARLVYAYLHSAINPPAYRADRTVITARELHQKWCSLMEENGWRYGVMYHHENLLHTEMVDFDRLTEQEVSKYNDFLTRMAR